MTILLRQGSNPGPAPGRRPSPFRHSLTLDAGWTDVADDVLSWLDGKGFGPRDVDTPDR